MPSSGKRSSSRKRLFPLLSATPHRDMAPWYGAPTHTTLCNLLAAFIGGQILLTAVFILRSSPPCDCRCQWQPDVESDEGKYERSLDSSTKLAQIAIRMDTDEYGETDSDLEHKVIVKEDLEPEDTFLSETEKTRSADLDASNEINETDEVVADLLNGNRNIIIDVGEVERDLEPTKHSALGSMITTTTRPMNETENKNLFLIDVQGHPEGIPEKMVVNVEIDSTRNALESHGSLARGLPTPFTILTTTNTAFSDLTENWLESIRRLEVPFNITLIAEDSGAFVHFMNRKSKLESSGLLRITLKYTDQNASLPNALGFYTKDYIQLVGKRPHYILDILSQGTSVLFADADAVWLKDPTPLIAKSYSNYDMWVALGEGGQIPCPCFMFIKPTPRAIAMVKAWQERIDEQLESTKPENDQVSLATVMHNHVKYRRLRVRKLDLTAFPTGQSMFLTKGWYATHRDEIYVVHANKVGGHAKKKFVLKWKKLWYLAKNVTKS